MQPTPRRELSSSSSNKWRRYLPFGAIVVVIALIIGIGIVASNGSDSGSNATSTTSGGGPAAAGPVTINDSNRTSVDWGPSCDTARGTVAVPLTYAPPCVKPFPKGADNGGATAPGVTADTITIALYQAQPDIVQQTAFQQAGSDEDLSTELRTVQQYVQFFEAHYETYGRHVKIVPVKASGAPDDEIAAKADALKVATEIKAFASWGGPGQTAAYAEELASRGVMCIGDCMLAATDQFVKERNDHVWLTFPSVDQLTEHWSEFIRRELAGREARFAGSPVLRNQKRVFGIVRFDESFAGLDQIGASFVKLLKRQGITMAAEAGYELDLTKAQENARLMITKMKAAHVTTVIFAGDPLTPSFLTQEATAQQYFPEWVVLGAAYTDTSLFGRTYDQRQWKHAFGVSSLPTPVVPTSDQLYTILVWQSGRGPEAKTFKVLVQAPLIFYTALQLAGPNLTAQTFRDGLYRFPSGPTAATNLHLSWGDHHIWPRIDQFGSDDATQIWWNPDAAGVDEVGNQGKGMWEYSRRGKRYLPGQWPTGEPDVFRPATSVTGFATVPPEQQAPSYPSPAG